MMGLGIFDRVPGGMGAMGLLLFAAAMLVVPTDGRAQERGWEAVVDGSRTGSYEASRYAPLVRMGDLLLGSGIIGTSREGPNDPETQFRRVFERLAEILEEQGLSIRDVAEITTYHVDLGQYGRDFIAVKNEFIPTPPYPAWTAVGVERLFLDDALIELRFTAVDPR